MSEKFTNLARSTLASGITAGALSLTVQSGDGSDLFPVLGGSDNFRCVLFKKSTGDIEIINVTARSGDVFTIARAQEQIGNIAATAFAFDAGDLVELRPTSAFYTGLAGGSTSANVQSGIFLYGVDTGAADVYTVAMNPTAASVTDGQEIRVKIGAGNTNTGIAATLQLDALATLDITMEGGGNPPSGSIKAGFVHTFIVNGTDAILQNAGLALTSSGFNALGKQIKNVAAGTEATDVATIGGGETHTNKTFTSPVINTQVSGTAFLDEDSMGSNSATKFCSQQSIKAYVDNQAFTVVNGITPYAGQVSSSGAFVSGSSGLSSARTSLGIFTITHNLGTGNYSFIVMQATSTGGNDVFWRNVKSSQPNGNNSCQVIFRDSGGTLTDCAFDFMILKY